MIIKIKIKREERGKREACVRRISAEIRFISARALCTRCQRQSSSNGCANFNEYDEGHGTTQSVQSLSNARGQILFVLRYAALRF